VTAPQRPREVLEAVRRLEAELDAVRAGARARERELDDLRTAIAADAARERRALVEDLERVVDLVGASWRSTNAQIAALTGEVAALRAFAEETAAALRGARLELRLEAAAAGRNGVAHGAPLPG
jgi:multidrug resistance efflux pump